MMKVVATTHLRGLANLHIEEISKNTILCSGTTTSINLHLSNFKQLYCIEDYGY